ncbi:MAG: hypothetical protein R3C10_19200 [Pirellulales bacterium]|nr:hypothetical protein [Planctomycetales bacterium]
MNRFVIWLLVGTLLALLCASRVSGAIEYQVIDLGTLAVVSSADCIDASQYM